MPDGSSSRSITANQIKSATLSIDLRCAQASFQMLTKLSRLVYILQQYSSQHKLVVLYNTQIYKQTQSRTHKLNCHLYKSCCVQKSETWNKDEADCQATVRWENHGEMRCPINQQTRHCRNLWTLCGRTWPRYLSPCIIVTFLNDFLIFLDVAFVYFRHFST